MTVFANCVLEETNMTSPTHEEKRQILQRHFLLGKLNPNEIDALISYTRVERYPFGREIFAKGSPGQCLMAVLRGSVKISSLSVGGKEIVFAMFNAGDIFGEIAVLDGEERSADANGDDGVRTPGFEPQGFFAGPRGSRRSLHDPSKNPLPSAATDDRAGPERVVPGSR